MSKRKPNLVKLNNASDPIEVSKLVMTPPEVAKLLRVSPEKVLGWIRRAELMAINVGNGVRPRFRIQQASFDAFLNAREVQPPAANVRRRRHPPSGNAGSTPARRTD